MSDQQPLTLIIFRIWRANRALFSPSKFVRFVHVRANLRRRLMNAASCGQELLPKVSHNWAMFNVCSP